METNTHARENRQFGCCCTGCTGPSTAAVELIATLRARRAARLAAEGAA